MQLICERLLKLPIEKDNGHIVVMAGGAGSGKSYTIKNFTNISDFSAVVDYDMFKPYILKSKKLKTDFYEWLVDNVENIHLEISSPDDINVQLLKREDFNNYVHDYVIQKKLFSRRLDTLMSNTKKPNIAIDGTLRYIPSTVDKLQKLYDVGYTPEKTHLIFVYTDVETNLRRNRKRVRSAGDSFVSSSYYDVLENILGFLKNKNLPAEISGSFTIIINDDGTNNTTLKYFTVMKDGMWSHGKITDFLEYTGITYPPEDDDFVYSKISESFVSLPYILFDYFGETYSIVEKSQSKYVIMNKERTRIIPNSLILGIEYIFTSSDSLETVKNKLIDIKYIRNIKG